SELGAEPDPKLHALAHVFKIEIDPYIGRLAVFRVHQGRLTPGGQLYIGEGRKPIKAGHLFLLRGKTQLEVNEALPGDICAIAKIDEIQFDHVLHDSAEDAQVHARPLELPTSVFGLAVQPKKRGDEQKVSDVLHKMTAEDPCFRIEHNSQANETVMRGLGEMHLRTVLEKMSSQYKLELDTRPPSIPYRETIAAKSAGRKAFLDALAKARPVVLEPIVNVDIIAPETKMGDIAGELSGHRGQIKGSDTPRPGTVQISAQAPLSELEHFPARLKSLTAGHGSYSLEFSHYEPAPPQLQQKLVAAHRPAATED